MLPFVRVYGAPQTLCRRCLLQPLTVIRQQTRSISQSWLKTQEEAKAAWDRQAELIYEGKLPHLWDQLKERGFVKDTAGTDDQIRELMRLKRIGAYVGIDPTASSLHVGHLVPLMALFWMYIHGFRAMTVVGGATAKVGDPTDRLKSRERIKPGDMGANITKVHYQLKRMWLNVDEQAARFGYVKERRVWSRGLQNNSMWYNNLPFVEVVARLFRGVRLGTMLSRDIVKRRMESGEGMGLDEFIYPLMQAWDWWHMFRKLRILMQIGGSDQYGNIVSGIECIKYLKETEPDPLERIPKDLLHTPVGFTTPLLTTSSGEKFGKSAGNAVWLDPFQTSSFDLYGYFMRRPDADVEQLLKLLTFHPLDKIKEIMEQQNQDPSKRHAQHALAFEVVALAHGLNHANTAQERHNGLFDNSAEDEVTNYPSDRPPTAQMATHFQADIELPESLVLGKSISRILYAAGLADSVTDGNRLTQQQGAYIAGAPGEPSATNRGMKYGALTFTPIKNWYPQDTRNFLIDDKLLILRRGKHFVRIVHMVSDKEWEDSGKMYPGEPGTGRVRLLKDALKRVSAIDDWNLADFDERKLLLQGMDKIYSEKGGILQDILPQSLQVGSNRASQILEKAMRPVQKAGPQSSRDKTNAIDEVLERIKNDVHMQASWELKKSTMPKHLQPQKPADEEKMKAKWSIHRIPSRDPSYPRNR
ncbi:hypothetical protein F4804DRAFT_111749 [Jackrogersella minutella]|nr:hypothetical protein F4804DRAFT_111749 [Jackrogersella minutella]